MDSKAGSTLLLLLSILCLFSSNSEAFNITRILSNYPDFSNFNTLLSQTGLAKEINGRQTITVLAVDNGSMGSVNGKPLDIAKRILGAHVILDYYDQTKLSNLKKKSSILTTLYQTTGTAANQQGFLNVTKTPNGIMFGSAVKDAPLSASLIGSVTSQPYNISVLQVSSVITAPGIDSMAPPPPPPPPGAAAPRPPKTPAPAKTPAEAPAPSDDKEAADAPTPAEAPETVADAPVSSPPVADAPAADEKEASAPKSGSSRVHVGAAAVVMGLAACMIGF